LDAIGRTIHKIGRVQKQTAEDYRAEKVMFVIITDGEENASLEYTAEKVRALIARQNAEYGWEFIFLGANIDAVQTAGRFGIAPDRAVDYLADSEGTKLNFKAMASAAAAFRETGTVVEACLEEIRKDVKRRGGRKKCWSDYRGYRGLGLRMAQHQDKRLPPLSRRLLFYGRYGDDRCRGGRDHERRKSRRFYRRVQEMGTAVSGRRIWRQVRKLDSLR
jgi:hypothetical protein